MKILNNPRFLNNLLFICFAISIYILLFSIPYYLLHYLNTFYVGIRVDLSLTPLEYTTPVKYLTAYDRSTASTILENLNILDAESRNMILDRIFDKFPYANRYNILKEVIVHQYTEYKPYDYIETKTIYSRIWKDDLKSPALYYFYATYGACSRIFFNLVYLICGGTRTLGQLTRSYEEVIGPFGLPVAWLVKYMREHNHFVDAWSYIRIRDWYRRRFNVSDVEVISHKHGVDVLYPTPEVLATEITKLDAQWEAILDSMHLQYVETICELASLF